MKTVKIHLLNKRYEVKPDRMAYGKINNRITDAVTEIDINTFAEEVGANRKPFTPTIFHGGRNAKNFAEEQVYALDFDGGITLEEFLSRADRYQVRPAFVYATYNHSEENPRFRAVFINDCVVGESRAASIILHMLHHIFPEADQSCKDVSRLYMGGKALLHKDIDAEINLADLALSLQEKMMAEDGANYSRNIKRFGKKNNIKTVDNILMIHRSTDGGESRPDTGQQMVIGSGQDMSPSYVIEMEDAASPHRECVHERKDIRPIYDKSYQDIANVCLLFKDHYEKDLTHQQKFFLATNLLHIKGGQKLFFDGLVDHHERWRVQWRYIKANAYSPQGCSDIDCPYKGQCGGRSLYHRLSSRIKRVRAEEGYIPMDEATEMLDGALRYALSQDVNGIYLIRAQTAIGKTTAYCKMARCWKGRKPLLIAVPTMDLQRQVEDDLRRCGVEPYTTKNKKDTLRMLGLDGLAETVGWLYEAGFDSKVNKEIIDYKKKNKDHLDQKTCKALDRLLEATKRLDGQRCVVTTHAMLLSLPVETLRRYEIIVDEDILMTAFKNTGTIPFHDLEAALGSRGLPSDAAAFIQEILGMEDGYVGHSYGIDDSCIDQLYDEGLFFNSPIPKLLTCSTFYVDVQGEQVHYFNARQIPDVKLVVVSASLNADLYAHYCCGKYINYVDVPLVQYKGRLLQYTAHSMSRSCIDNFGYDNVKAGIYKITQKTDINWITFLRFDGSRGIYFGKTEGFNHYQGKDLVVLGTPHNVPFMYQLIGAYLGYRTGEKMSVKMVEHNGYAFPIMTFNDPDMRNLQFYFLESELEQSVGRARLLRNHCTVYLFSNFPCRQTELIQDDYMAEWKDVRS